jgi:hypothetical protein
MNTENHQYERLIDRAAKLAAEYELKYFGCSQTTLAGLIEALASGGRISFDPLHVWPGAYMWGLDGRPHDDRVPHRTG